MCGERLCRRSAWSYALHQAPHPQRRGGHNAEAENPRAMREPNAARDEDEEEPDVDGLSASKRIHLTVIQLYSSLGLH